MLTPASLNQTGSLVLPDLGGFNSFTASFDYQFTSGTGPKGGICFCFGPSQTAAFGENGAATSGHVITFDTTAGNITYYESGSQKASKAAAFSPTSDAGAYRRVTISLSSAGTLTVTYKGAVVFTSSASYSYSAGDCFSFGASTPSNGDSAQSVDNLGVLTGSAAAPLASLDIGAAEAVAASTTLTVVTAADTGTGSLRATLAAAPAGSTVVFASGLSGRTVTLGSQITLSSSVTLDASALAGGLTLSGNGAVELFQINGGPTIAMKSLTLTEGLSSQGGAIDNLGTLTLSQCTLSGNSADNFNGGGIANSGTLTLTQCTLFGNSAGGGGGAIHNAGTLTLTHCTLSGNSAAGGGGGIDNTNAGTLTLTNTIVAGNTSSGAGGPDIDNSGTLTLAGVNFIGDLTATGKSASASLLTGNAMLAPLGSYGGPTQTMPPLYGSPAIDAAMILSPAITTDQRGLPLADGNGDGSALPDIGAAEANAPLVVNTTADSGNGSLRAALAAAAAAPGPDIILFSSTTLSGQTLQPVLNSNAAAFTLNDTGGVTVDASALAAGLTLDSSQLPSDNALFHVQSGALALRGLTLHGRSNADVSSMIENNGTLTLTQCILSANAANAGNNGGAVFNDGTLSLTQCTLSGNSASLGLGGAIFNSGTLTLTQCTLSGNSAPDGGAIANTGTLTLTQCTVSGNHATGTNAKSDGGGGIDSFDSSPVTLTNTLIAGNTAASGSGPDFWHESGTLAATNCLIGDATNSDIANGTNGNITGVDALLAPLASNGGPTQTMMPLPGSPAIDAAGATTSSFSTDQRGSARVVDGDGNGSVILDIGAVEVSPALDYANALAFSAATFNVGEEAKTALVPLVRTGPYLPAADVTVTSTDGTAKSPGDYTMVESVASFAAGQSTTTVAVPIVADTSATNTNKTFTLTLSGTFGPGASLGAQTTCAVTILANDVTPPTVTLTAPAANAVIAEAAGPSIHVTGSASDNLGLASVLVSLNGAAFAPATLTLASSGKTGTFTLPLTLVPGPNSIAVQSVDTRGNTSIVTSRGVSYVVTGTLAVAIAGPSGSGTVSAGFVPTSQRNLGASYTIAATPKAGYVFNGWTANSFTGTGVTATAAQVATLKFTMQPGLSLTANFIKNPFVAGVTGTFNGLVVPQLGTPTQVDTMGMLQNAVVTSTGAFTSTLKIAGLSVPVNGVFDNTGAARFGTGRSLALALARANLPSLLVSLNLNMAGGGLTGTVTQSLDFGSSTYTSSITAQPALYSATSKVFADLAGTTSKPYTLLLPAAPQVPALDLQDYPQGTGYATMTLGVTGTVAYSGRLADNTPISGSAALVAANQWPLFVSLYSGHGCLWGTVAVTDADASTYDVTSNGLLWVRPEQDTSQWYPGGWPEGVLVGLVGARYVIPPRIPASSVFPGLQQNPPSADATLSFTGGLLTSAPVFGMNINPLNAAYQVPVLGTATLVITSTTGAVTGTFLHTDGTRPTYYGAILQKGPREGAQGYFMSTSPRVLDGFGQSGSMSAVAK